jgi:hypothetical protein
MFFLLFCIGCQKFEHIGTKDGQTIFLDSSNGKVIYINNSNRVVDYVDLKLNKDEIRRIKNDKELNDSAQKMKIWGERNIPGTKYTLELSTRFYNDKLLYILQIGPYDDGISRLANTITVDLVDLAGFSLETIDPTRWIRSVDASGKAQKLSASGDLPITLENYFEISEWDPSWRN